MTRNPETVAREWLDEHVAGSNKPWPEVVASLAALIEHERREAQEQGWKEAAQAYEHNIGQRFPFLKFIPVPDSTATETPAPVGSEGRAEDDEETPPQETPAPCAHEDQEVSGSAQERVSGTAEAPELRPGREARTVERAALKRGGPLRRVSRQAIKDKTLDDLCRKLVVELRDLNTCQRCARCSSDPMPYKIHWAHVVTRNAKSIQWTPWNSLALCFRCHRWFDREERKAGREWWAKTWPKRALALRAWRHEKKHKTENRLLIKLHLQQQIAQVESGIRTCTT